MKNKFKQLISFSLSVLLLITSVPITTLADGAIGAGDTSSSSTGLSGNGSFNSSMIGYRFTLVDKQGNTVSQLNGKPASVDVSWFDLNNIGMKTKYYFTNSKLEEISSMLGIFKSGKKSNKIIPVTAIEESLISQINEYFSNADNVRDAYVRTMFSDQAYAKTHPEQMNKLYEDLKRMSDAEVLNLASQILFTFKTRYTMVPWLQIANSNVYSGQGEQFKKWMLGKRTDSMIEEGSNGGNYSSGGSSGGSSNSGNNNGSSNSGSSSKPSGGSSNKQPSNTTSTQAKSATKAKSAAELDYFKSNCKYITSSLKRRVDKITQTEYSKELNSWQKDQINKASSYYATGKMNYDDYEAAKKEIYDTFQILVNYEHTYRQMTASNKPRYNIFTAIKEAFGPMTVYAATDKNKKNNSGKSNAGKKESASGNKADKVNEEIKENEFVGNEAFGKFLINSFVNNEYVFELEKVKDGTYENPLIACGQEEYILLVEPLYAFIPRDVMSKKNFSSYVIGTTTSFSQGMLLLRENNLWSWNSGKSELNNRVSNKTAPKSMYTPDEFPNEDIGYMDASFKIVPPDNSNLPGWISETSTEAIPYENMVACNKLDDNTYVGFGLHVYVFGRGSGTTSRVHTWDSPNYPDTPGPSENPTNKEIETEYGDKSKNIKIVKYYQTRWELESGEFVEPTEYFTVTGNPHTILIDDEAKGPGYKLKDYFTSETDWTPPENGDPAKYDYESSKASYKNGKYSGQLPTTLKIQPDDEDIVLHILLEWQPEFDKTIEVIKVYDTNGIPDNITVEKDVEVGDNYEADTVDGDYVFKEATTDSVIPENEPGSWTDVPQNNHTVSTAITVDDSTEIIYIHYVKGDIANSNKQIVLAENELTHSFMLNDLTEDGSLRSLSRTFKAIASKSCSYSWSESCDKHGSHTRYCKADLTRSYTDSNYIHTVSNHEVYDKGFVYQTNETNGTNSGEASSVSGFDGNEFNPNMSFVINRSYTDKVTLYPGKNGNVAQLQDIGTLGESYIPQGQRYNNKKESDRIQWFNTFRTNYRYDTVTDPEGEWKDDGHGYGSNWPRQASFETSGKTVSNLNEAYSKSNNVNILAFLGKTGKGVDVPDTSPKPFEFGGKTFKTNLNVKQNASGNIKFYPSILMKMQMLGGSETNVYVTSENSSELVDVRRAEVGVYKNSSKPALNLSSYQWSSHFKSLDMLNSKNISDTKSVLPGGAAYELKTSDSGDASEVWIGFKTYTTCVEDGTVSKLADTANVLKLSTVQADNEAFKNTVKNNLEHFQIVQEVVSGVHMDNAEFDSSSPVKVSGPGQENKFGGNTLDRSSKYYLKTDGAGADRADLDILSEAGKQIVWKLTADEEGNVTVYKDGVKLKSISKIQGEGIFLSDPELKNLNDKTKVITNFIKSLDRNKGNDRNDTKWYNEGFDSILVVENGFSFKVGFGGTHPIRGSVLDTKLCGKLDSRSDLYNYEETDKIRTSVFRTSDRSTSAVAGKAPGYVGTIHGLDVSIPSMKYLFTSKFFLIPNATVTDLN